MSKKHILYLYETAVGLGHQRRASGIVNGLVEAGHEVFVASGTFVDAENYFDPRIKLINLPAIRRSKDQVVYFYDESNQLTEDTHYDPVAWQQQRADAIRPFASANKIDVVMAEWWPFDRRRYFDKVISEVLKTQNELFGAPPLLVSSVRDVLTAGTASVPTTAAEQSALNLINKYVDAVMVHGDQALVSLRDTFSPADNILKPVIYTGYVVNADAKQSPGNTRNTSVIASCGSGDEGHHLLKAFARALPLSALRDRETHFVMGPRMEAPQREELFRMAAQFNAAARRDTDRIHFCQQMPELPSRLVHADFSGSLAGYNTTMEVLASRIPCLLVPKFTEENGRVTRVDQEQWERLQRLRDKNMASIAHPDETLDPRGFANAINMAYAQGEPVATLDMNGIENTVQQIERLLARQQGKARRPKATGLTSLRIN